VDEANLIMVEQQHDCINLGNFQLGIKKLSVEYMYWEPNVFAQNKFNKIQAIYNGVGRKISRGGGQRKKRLKNTKERPKNSTSRGSKPLPGGPTNKKD